MDRQEARLQEAPPRIPALYDLGECPRKGRRFVVWQGFTGLQGPSKPLFCKHTVLALTLKAPVCAVSPAQLAHLQVRVVLLGLRAFLLELQPCLHDLLMPDCSAGIYQGPLVPPVLLRVELSVHWIKDTTQVCKFSIPACVKMRGITVRAEAPSSLGLPSKEGPSDSLALLIVPLSSCASSSDRASSASPNSPLSLASALVAALPIDMQKALRQLPSDMTLHNTL